MTCLCKYLTPERFTAAGLDPRDARGKICISCAANKEREPVSYKVEPTRYCQSCGGVVRSGGMYCYICRDYLERQRRSA